MDIVDRLRRAGPFPGHDDRMIQGPGRGHHLFQGDFMFPALPGVVEIGEHEPHAFLQGEEPVLLFVEAFRLPDAGAMHGRFIADLADQELMDVGIAPAHASLDDVVQLGQVRISRHLDPPPDEGIGEGDGDMEDIARDRFVRFWDIDLLCCRKDAFDNLGHECGSSLRVCRVNIAADYRQR